MAVPERKRRTSWLVLAVEELVGSVADQMVMGAPVTLSDSVCS